MPLQAFTFPVPETRFFQAGRQVFKFKIRRGDKNIITLDEEEMLHGVVVTEELENAVRVVLANLETLQPFATQHFNIFPYKTKWEQVSKMRFMKDGTMLSPYPFLITLFVEYRESVLQYTVTDAYSWNNSKTLPGLTRPEEQQADQVMESDLPEEGTGVPFFGQWCGNNGLWQQAVPQFRDRNATRQTPGLLTRLAR
ncbi:hypothetical protein DNTS_007922 [Danionella cerebrum]|uniref:Uncharacterized protein n=1 Tax=Danionella cerebrum TaxID=2873325 RepID=A0A553PVS0_9TELE|nr:hypothetical protein DNTS_007922 [Danionella translucida]